MSDCACDICNGAGEPPAAPCDCETYKALAAQPKPSFPGYPRSKPLAIEAFPGEIEGLRRKITTLKWRADMVGRWNVELRAEKAELQARIDEVVRRLERYL